MEHVIVSLSGEDVKVARLTARELANTLGLSHRAVQHMVARGMPSVIGARRTRFFDIAEVSEWRAAQKRAVASKREDRKKARRKPAILRACKRCGGAIGKAVLYCTPCRDISRAESQARANRSAQHMRKTIPEWTPDARAHYEAGESIASVAGMVGQSKSTIQIYSRLQKWDRDAHRSAREAALFPWREKVRPLWEGGEPYAVLREITGLSETSLREWALKWGWDGDARRDAILQIVRGGRSKREHTRLRAMAHKYAKRSRSKERASRRDLAILIAASPLCCYCGERVSADARTIDHVDPLVHGGSADLSNLAVACLSCNSSKSDTPLVRWLAERARRKSA